MNNKFRYTFESCWSYVTDEKLNFIESLHKCKELNRDIEQNIGSVIKSLGRPFKTVRPVISLTLTSDRVNAKIQTSSSLWEADRKKLISYILSELSKKLGFQPISLLKEEYMSRTVDLTVKKKRPDK